jgi:hypothetical protein
MPAAALGWYPQQKRLGGGSQLAVGTVLEGGNNGDRVIFEGTPRALLSAKGSLTSQYLRQ